MPSNIVYQRANVAKEEDWKRLMAMAHEKYGRVDILVNNAGTSYPNKVLGNLPSR
jgi:NAD(P)-dependent dehydrogenase (short-subunit alcohol dehydrogenase family)